VTIDQVMHQFAKDDKVKWVLLVVALDLILGVCAAIKTGTFRLSYVSDFLRNDIFGKFVPWFALYATGKFTTQTLPGVDVSFSALANGAYGLMLAALGGSIAKSLVDLGLRKEAIQQRMAPAPTRTIAGERAQQGQVSGRKGLETALFRAIASPEHPESEVAAP
jgi:hypothetical protein